MGTYGRFDLQYVKTDKNGTKYYYDINCPRCCGQGGSFEWARTEYTCWKCGGTGKRSTPKLIKVYTPEYEAKLEARRNAKAARYQEEHAEEIAQAKAEEERREAKRLQRENERTCMDLGCNADGTGYVLTGKTYQEKEQIKAAGGKWIASAWVCPTRYESKNVKPVAINLSGLVNEYGIIPFCDGLDLIWETAHR